MDKYSYCIIAPCYNEEQVIALFLKDLEDNLGVLGDAHFQILVINDASIDNSLEELKAFKFMDERFSLKIVSLEQNQGHQAAINVGLNYARGLERDFEAVVVMDSDGEDDPKAILQVLKDKNREDIVFVSRAGRKEGIRFKIGYRVYKTIFFLIVGKRINYGNFSILSKKVLRHIANQSFLHYPTFLSKQNFSIQYFPYNRRQRIDGSSKMNTKSLIFHGLYSLIELGEEVLFFFIKILGVFFVLTFGMGIYIVLSKFVFNTAIQGWASSFGIGLVIICLIILCTIVLGLMLVSMKKQLKTNEVSCQVYE